jgi:hypothetical protein
MCNGLVKAFTSVIPYYPHNQTGETDGNNVTHCVDQSSADCKGNLTDLRRILHLSLAKGNPK